MPSALLQTVALGKTYGRTVALDDVGLSLRAGEVQALLGRNGAGKSTLVKILSGAVLPDRGQVLLDGQPLHLRSPREARQRGIATVYQELSLVPELSVAENLLFGRWPQRRRLGLPLVDWKELYRQAERALRGLGVTLDLHAPVRRLGMAQQQLVEIAKALAWGPKVLILDEPTSALAQHEVERLLKLVRAAAAAGTAVVYISHRLQELPLVADVVSVLRDGRHVGTIGVRQATPSRLAEMMFGQELAVRATRQQQLSGPPVLEVRGLTSRGKFHDVNLQLRPGEVLGLAGTLGAGRSELLLALFGAEPFDSGEVRVAGRPVRRPTPAVMRRLGVALVPEDRKSQGLVLGMSVRDNLCLAGLNRTSLGGLLWQRRQDRATRELVAQLEIGLADAGQPVSALSGGNQQKVVLGKWLHTRPRIMLFDEPTRGIDLATKQQVFELVRRLSAAGVASIFVSSEWEELLEVCHRIVVLRGGRVVGDLPAAEARLETLMALCMEACA